MSFVTTFSHSSQSHNNVFLNVVGRMYKDNDTILVSSAVLLEEKIDHFCSKLPQDAGFYSIQRLVKRVHKVLVSKILGRLQIGDDNMTMRVYNNLEEETRP